MGREDLIRFLEDNSNSGHWESARTRLVNDIANRIGDFVDNYNPRHVYRGVELIDESLTVGWVDIAVLTNNGDLVIIEAEIAPSRRNRTATRNRVIKRLQRDSDYFNDKFGVLPITLGVYRVEHSSNLKRVYSGVIPPIGIDYAALQTT